MRDLTAIQFEQAAKTTGFSHVPHGSVYSSRDGLRVQAVLKGSTCNHTHNIDRRETLAAMKRARKAHRAAAAANREATGAATPMASV